MKCEMKLEILRAQHRELRALLFPYVQIKIYSNKTEFSKKHV